LQDTKDKNRFSTAWAYATEYIKMDYERTRMQRHIVNAFLSSAIVTENNKKNLLGLVSTISDAVIKGNYIQRIKVKQPAQKDSTLE
jgi:hypothetical protein